MAQVLANNISDRTNPPGGPRAIDIGAVRIWPGRAELVQSEDLTPAVLALRGTFLELGHLPAGYLAAEPAPTGPMSENEIRAYLEKLSLAQLHALADGVSPPVSKRPNAARMVHALSRACRSVDSLDPKTFFFTRNWKRVDRDTYIPVE